MKEVEKSLASKTEVKNTLDFGDKNRKKQKNFMFDSSYILVKVTGIVNIKLGFMG